MYTYTTKSGLTPNKKVFRSPGILKGEIDFLIIAPAPVKNLVFQNFAFTITALVPLRRGVCRRRRLRPAAARRLPALHQAASRQGPSRERLRALQAWVGLAHHSRGGVRLVT
jgi:hypothetical protein